MIICLSITFHIVNRSPYFTVAFAAGTGSFVKHSAPDPVLQIPPDNPHSFLCKTP